MQYSQYMKTYKLNRSVALVKKYCEHLGVNKKKKQKTISNLKKKTLKL